MVKLMVDTNRRGYAYLYNLNRKRGQPFIKAEKLIPMSWDDEKKPKTTEEIVSQAKFIAQVYKVEQERKNETPEQRHERITNRRNNRRKRN